MGTIHGQVPFVRIDGETVDVDAGMRDILEHLRNMGIKTQYSCEGSKITREAYVLMDMRSAIRLRRAVKRALRTRTEALGQPHVETLTRFIEASSRTEIAYLRSVERYTKPHLELVWKIQIGDLVRRGYKIENTINRYGVRTTLRWPADHNAQVEQALEALASL